MYVCVHDYIHTTVSVSLTTENMCSMEMFVCAGAFVCVWVCLCVCVCVCVQEQAPMPVYHPTPSQARLATQLTEEEQVRIAQRIGLIQHLPKGLYDPGHHASEKKIRER